MKFNMMLVQDSQVPEVNQFYRDLFIDITLHLESNFFYTLLQELFSVVINFCSIKNLIF